MSKLNIYAIKDVIVGELMNPILMHNDEEAKRTFTEAINANNPQSNICKNYKDMQMFKLGEYDTITGEIKSDVNFLIAGIDVKAEQAPTAVFNVPLPKAEE